MIGIKQRERKERHEDNAVETMTGVIDVDSLGILLRDCPSDKGEWSKSEEYNRWRMIVIYTSMRMEIC